MRVDDVLPYRERRDSLDHRWNIFLAGLDLVPLFIPNNLSDDARELLLNSACPCGVILTGGNDLSTLDQGINIYSGRDDTESKLISWCVERTLPVIGVCRGMQLLTQFFGGSVRKVNSHVGSDHKVIFLDQPNVEIEVNSFHNYSPDPQSFPLCLDVTARSTDGEIEAMRHKSMPIHGVMWHPERNVLPREVDVELFNALLGL